MDLVLPEDLVAAAGLKNPMELTGVGNLCVITGPNGAGKTRVLKVLRDGVERLAQNPGAFAYLSQEADWLAWKTDPNAALDELDRILASAGDMKDEERLYPISVQTRRWWSKHNVGLLRNVVRAIRVNRGIDILARRKHFTLTYDLQVSANRPESMNPESHQQVVAMARTPGFSGPAQAAHAYLHDLAWNALLERHSLPGSEPDAEQRLGTMNALLRALLGVELGFSAIDPTTRTVPISLGGRPFAWNQLSQGQRILLVWAIQLHAQRAELEGALVFLDEPEIHLHPAAVVDALDRLVRLVGSGTVFVATHSLSIVAYATPARCWYLRDSRLEYAGGTGFDGMISGLVGDERAIGDLYDLLSERSVVALYQFAAQCLADAGVAGFQQGDRQQNQLVAALDALRGDGALSVLEYGAGRGRLAAALAEAGQAGRVRYGVVNDERYTPDEVDDACRRALASLNGDDAGPYLRSLRDLRTGYDDSFDVIVLCNVLHEIGCHEWPDHFHAFARVLKPNGLVLLLEDQQMKVGELPTSVGFLTLDDVELAALFGCRSADVLRFSHPKEHRLTAFGVRRELLGRASRDTVADALDRLTERAEKELAAIRDRRPQEPGFAEGRAHAFFAMVLANAHLAKRSIGSTTR